MNIYEDTNPRRLNTMLSLIHNGEMALPDFQRSFVWDPSATQELIISIASGYPAGSLLRVRNSNTLFSVREFENAPALNGKMPNYLVLDGQQRLTSLYQAFYGKGEHKYYLDLNKLLEGSDFEESIFHMRAKKGIQSYGAIEQQVDHRILPLEMLYGSDTGYHGWKDDVIDHLEDEEKMSKEEIGKLRRRLQLIYDEHIKNIDQYEFPVVTLSADTTAPAVCTIFETLNRTGIKLSVFELLTARFWHQKVNLRFLFEDAKREYPLIDDFEIDPYYILQSISLLRTEKAPTCKRKDLLSDLTADHINKSWTSVVKALNDIITILIEECGVLTSKWLPYYTILIPMTAVLAKQNEAKGIEVGVIRKKIVRWYWCSVFSQSYENAPNSQAAKDFSELSTWLNGANPPETVSKFHFDIDQLRDTTPRQRAVYKAVIGLILNNRPIDFYEGKTITTELLKNRKIDDHHIYPKAHLESLGIIKIQRDSVLNRTLIDRATNQSIGKRPPSEYLTDIQNNLGLDILNNVLKSHLITDNASSFSKESFKEFTESRLEILRNKIQEVTNHDIKAADGYYEKK